MSLRWGCLGAAATVGALAAMGGDSGRGGGVTPPLGLPRCRRHRQGPRCKMGGGRQCGGRRGGRKGGKGRGASDAPRSALPQCYHGGPSRCRGEDSVGTGGRFRGYPHTQTQAQAQAHTHTPPPPHSRIAQLLQRLNRVRRHAMASSRGAVRGAGCTPSPGRILLLLLLGGVVREAAPASTSPSSGSTGPRCGADWAGGGEGAVSS